MHILGTVSRCAGVLQQCRKPVIGFAFRRCGDEPKCPGHVLWMCAEHRDAFFATPGFDVAIAAGDAITWIEGEGS